MVLDMCMNSPRGSFIPHASAIVPIHTHNFMSTNSTFTKAKASSFHLMRKTFNTFGFYKEKELPTSFQLIFSQLPY